jgi:transcriptional repressor NrdR
MYCPYCSNAETKVLESRILDATMRRRRECLKCLNRFTTYENAKFNLKVIKKDGREVGFEFKKIISSIQKACGKTSLETVDMLANKVQKKILNKKTNLIKSITIGKLVLSELKKFDKMAYLRFATVYKEIDDPQMLEQELQVL